MSECTPRATRALFSGWWRDGRRAVVVAAIVVAASCLPAQETGAGAAPDAVSAAAAGTASKAALPPLIPKNVSTFGQDVDDLFNLILAITLTAMVVVLGLLVYFMIKYRYREGRKVVYTHGSNKLEVFWTVATAAVLIFIAFSQQSTWVKIKQQFPDPSKEEVYLARVFGEQFSWHFVYPGQDGKFEPEKLENRFPGFNDVGLENPDGDVVKATLLVPVHTKVLLQINSLGKYDQQTSVETLPVLHSFFAPNFRVKQDLVPYHPGYVWFEAMETGKFEIACAELCGLGHYTMRADIQVLTDAELETQLGYDWRQHKATFVGVDGQATAASTTDG